MKSQDFVHFKVNECHVELMGCYRHMILEGHTEMEPSLENETISEIEILPITGGGYIVTEPYGVYGFTIYDFIKNYMRVYDKSFAIIRLSRTVHVYNPRITDINMIER